MRDGSCGGSSGSEASPADRKTEPSRAATTMDCAVGSARFVEAYPRCDRHASCAGSGLRCALMHRGWLDFGAIAVLESGGAQRRAILMELNDIGRGCMTAMSASSGSQGQSGTPGDCDVGYCG